MQMKHWKLLVTTILLYFVLDETIATHIRAGQITARRISNVTLTYEFVITMYTDNSSQADSRELTLNFGNGSSTIVPRELKQDIGNNTSINIYRTTFTYGSPGSYLVYFVEPNRNITVNIPNSENVAFSVSTLLMIDPFVGLNNTPILTVAPVDLACPGQRYTHNPGGFDADGDSLSYRLIVPRRSNTQDVAGYIAPNSPVFGGTAENGGPVIFNIDARTGTLTWDAPNTLGNYNIAFVVEEWRNGVRIGFVVRDMQITVVDCLNRRPTVIVPRDTCVEANSTLVATIRATDPDGDRINLTAGGGVFDNTFPLQRATFTPLAPQPQPTPASAEFRWNVGCVHVREQPYEVIFKAEDVPSPPPSNRARLSDIKAWRITVVGPKPQNLQATPVGNTMVLTWSPYVCASFASEIIIWRKVGCDPWTPANCETGVPPYVGYQEIGRVPATATTFTDTNRGQGLKRGAVYSYRISAVFPRPKGGASYASDQVCKELLQDVPIITKVSVEQTSPTNGRIDVQWVRPPDLNPNDFTNPNPYRYELQRAEGLNGTNFVTIQTIIDDSPVINFIDLNLNTQDLSYRYRVRFSVNQGGNYVFRDNSDPASSVRLKAEPANNAVKLTWEYNVPWSNFGRRHKIFREVNGNFIEIGNVLVGQTEFVDVGTPAERLRAGTQYCYYVQTEGSYGNPKIPIEPLLNKSQISCAIPFNNIPPCPPALTMDTLDCLNFNINLELQNRLRWRNVVAEGCLNDIVKYNIYYTPVEGGEFTLIGSTTDLTFIHRNLESQAGCYAVTAVDFSGNESELSNVTCIDNCFYFELPNVVTINNDGFNDKFQPYPVPRFVKSVKFTVRNRWGDVVKTIENDIFINWDGTSDNQQPLPDGTYFYEAEVEFIRVRRKDMKKKYVGWIKLMR
ncbi:MAG: gliding motility-associated C-terminal domain-containing protein [Microscillaceae bacterium]|nr:gliding motility-associated C-terminal domain-containing protein [Microscillaceae bacterium]MDW8461506.1 gliding motility-associated C-terminal domain-containing protein [Cytophagales bacterium]